MATCQIEKITGYVTTHMLQPGSTVVPLKGRPHMVLYELNEFIKEYREQTNITETKDRAAGQGERGVT